MKRLALGVAAIAALATLTACGGSDSDSDSTAKSESPAATPTETEEDAAAPAEDRFVTIYSDVAELFAVISEQEDTEPADTDEANAAAGLDDTTSLLFADYTVDPEDENTGSFCLVSPEDTFVSFAFSGAGGEVTIGDGECSYDPADAAVVGDVASDEWSVGGELMGDTVPTYAFGA